MKIVKVPKPLLFLFFLGMRKTLLFFSLSLSFSHHQILLVSKFISLVKSTNLFIFFIFNVIVVVIMFGSSKPSVRDFNLFSLLPLERKGGTANYEDYDYDNEPHLECIEYKEKKAIAEENDAKENNFLPLLVYIGLGENKGNGQEYDDKRNDFLPSLALEFDKEKGKDEEGNDFLPRLEYVELDEKKGNDECCADKDIEFVPRLVYVELTAKKVDDENFDGIELDGDGYCRYNDGYNDDDDTENEDEKLMDGDDLKRRIEEFIAKNNKRWKEEI